MASEPERNKIHKMMNMCICHTYIYITKKIKIKMPTIKHVVPAKSEETRREYCYNILLVIITEIKKIGYYENPTRQRHIRMYLTNPRAFL